LTCFVDSDRRPRLAAPEPAAEAAGEDTVAVVVLTADAGGVPPGASEPAAEAAGEDTVAVAVLTADASGAPPRALAAGVDAGTTAVPAGGSCAGGVRGVDNDVSAGVEQGLVKSEISSLLRYNPWKYIMIAYRAHDNGKNSITEYCR